MQRYTHCHTEGVGLVSTHQLVVLQEGEAEGPWEETSFSQGQGALHSRVRSHCLSSSLIFEDSPIVP